MPFYRSRRFWLGTLDLIISLILLFIGIQYPPFLESAKTVIYALQPLVVALIIAWTVEGTLMAQFMLAPAFITSRKFWLGVLDIVISFILLLASVQFPDYQQVLQTIIYAIQPLIVALIVAWTVDDTLRTFAMQLRSNLSPR